MFVAELVDRITGRQNMQCVNHTTEGFGNYNMYK